MLKTILFKNWKQSKNRLRHQIKTPTKVSFLIHSPLPSIHTIERMKNMNDYNVNNLLQTLTKPEIQQFLAEYFEESFHMFFSDYLGKFESSSDNN